MDDYGIQKLKNLILKIELISTEEYMELFEKARMLDSIKGEFMLTKKIKYEYTCLLCNFKFESETEIESQLCPKCMHIYKITYPEPIKPYDYPDGYPPQITYTNNTDVDPCLHCSNHPRNGGSGVCLCTIPYMRRGY